METDAVNDDDFPVEDLWLADFLAKRDILLLKIIEAEDGRREMVGRILHCYTTLYSGAGRYSSGELRFISGGAGWGNAVPEEGETILISIVHRPDSIPSPSTRMYERHCGGHFGIREIGGQLCAIAKYPLDGIQGVPRKISESLQRVPEAPMYSALPFALLEDYLLALIPRMHRIEPVRSLLDTSKPEGPYTTKRSQIRIVSRQHLEVFRAFALRRKVFLSLCAVEPQAPNSPRFEDPWETNPSARFLDRYCLHGVYSREGVNLWKMPLGERIRAELNFGLGAERIQFGPLDTWEYRKRPRLPVLFFEPTGDIYILLTDNELASKFAFHCLPWSFASSTERSSD